MIEIEWSGGRRTRYVPQTPPPWASQRMVVKHRSVGLTVTPEAVDLYRLGFAMRRAALSHGVRFMS